MLKTVYFMKLKKKKKLNFYDVFEFFYKNYLLFFPALVYKLTPYLDYR